MLSPKEALGGPEMMAAKQKMWNSDPAGRMRSRAAHAAATDATTLVETTMAHSPALVPCGITEAPNHAASISTQKDAPTLSWVRSRSTWPGTRP